MVRICFAIALLAIGTNLASAQDWPQFRGPNFQGYTNDKKPLPTTWSDKENVVWKTALPARGLSSPVIVEDRIYLTANSGFRNDKLHVFCIDRSSGKMLWQRELTATGNTGCHPKTNMAAPTPVADATGVYALFATGDLAAFDKDGTMRWYRSLVADYPTIGNQVGMASSPVLANNTLVVPMDNSGDSFITGIDPRYGTTIWKTPRFRDSNWTTPLVYPGKDGTQILMLGTRELTSYSPETGKALWTIPTDAGGISSPVPADGKILYSARGVIAFDPQAADKTKPLWKQMKLSGSSATPVYFDNRVYNISSAKILVCADAATGKEIWTERINGKGDYWASPIVGDGKLYVFRDDGVTTVAKLGDKAEILATNELKEEILGTPAICDGRLFIRTDKHLFCIGDKK